MLTIKKAIRKRWHDNKELYVGILFSRFFGPFESEYKILLQRMENYVTGNSNALLSKPEAYIIDVLLSYSGIVRIFADLESCIFLMSRSPSASYLRNVNMKPIDYFLYHLKMFFILLVSLEDVCLALVNKTCEFGLRDQDIKFHIIYGSPRIRRTDIEKRLSAIHKFMEKHRKFRNISIHQAKTVPSEDLGKLFLQNMFIDVLPDEEKQGFLHLKTFSKILLERELQKCIEAQTTMYKLISDLATVVSDWAVAEKERKLILAKVDIRSALLGVRR